MGPTHAKSPSTFWPIRRWYTPFLGNRSVSDQEKSGDKGAICAACTLYSSHVHSTQYTYVCIVYVIYMCVYWPMTIVHIHACYDDYIDDGEDVHVEVWAIRVISRIYVGWG
jgi:hypothetical protein